MSYLDKPRARVNASMLPQFQGRLVCLLGRVKSVGQDGASFVITSCDEQDVIVKLMEPLNDMIEGLVEVIGEVGHGCEVNCEHYVSFGEINFDMNLYNEAVKLTNQFPQYHTLAEEV